MEPSSMPPESSAEQCVMQQRCPLAIASLILGLASLFCLLGPLAAIPAIICGFVGLGRIQSANGQLTGKGLALAGISFSGISLALTAVVAVFGILSFFTQVNSRHVEANSRSSCQNNLKQMGLVFKMFANESKGQVFPELSTEPGQLMCVAKAIYPEYLSDPSILHCPSDADPYSPDGAPESKINHESYTYLGYVITSDDELQAFVAVYKDRLAKQLPFNEDLPAPPGKGSFGSDKFFRLREGIERFGITDINDPAASAKVQSSIPILWDNIGTSNNGTMMYFNHIPGGSNVLYMDGHVEFVKYPSKFPVSKLTAELLSELDSLGASK